MTADLQRLLEPETAGDPMSSLKWTRRSTRKLARQLQRMGHCIGATTVARLLKSLGFKLRVNRKSVACSRHPDRDRQFRRIEQRRASFGAKRLPIISIDTKICSAEHIAVWTKPLRGTGGLAIGRFPIVVESVG